jgi:hypothetical protein
LLEVTLELLVLISLVVVCRLILPLHICLEHGELGKHSSNYEAVLFLSRPPPPHSHTKIRPESVVINDFSAKTEAL